MLGTTIFNMTGSLAAKDAPLPLLPLPTRAKSSVGFNEQVRGQPCASSVSLMSESLFFVLYGSTCSSWAMMLSRANGTLSLALIASAGGQAQI